MNLIAFVKLATNCANSKLVYALLLLVVVVIVFNELFGHILGNWAKPVYAMSILFWGACVSCQMPKLKQF